MKTAEARYGYTAEWAKDGIEFQAEVEHLRDPYCRVVVMGSTRWAGPRGIKIGAIKSAWVPPAEVENAIGDLQRYVAREIWKERRKQARQALKQRGC